jgi:hypothetical protein
MFFSNKLKCHLPLCADLQRKKIEQFPEFRTSLGGYSYMAEYEIVIEEEFSGRSPPRQGT